MTAYPDFVADFGTTIDFGAYTDGTVDDLVNKLCSIILSKDYPALCENAHRTVADFTWDNYVADFIQTLESINAGKIV